MATDIVVSIISGNGLLPDVSKPLPEPVLTYHQLCSVAIAWEQFHKKWTTFLSATKQLYEWFGPSARLSVWPSVCPSYLFHYVPIIISSWNVMSYCQWQKWCLCKRAGSKVKVTEVKTQFSQFWTVIPAWFHIWWWNYAQSLMLLRKGVLLFSRSSIQFQGHTAKKNHKFWPKLGISGL